MRWQSLCFVRWIPADWEVLVLVTPGHRGPCSGHSRAQRSLFWSLQATEVLVLVTPGHRGPCSGHSRPQRSLFWSLQGTEVLVLVTPGHRGPCSGHSRAQRSLFWSLQATEVLVLVTPGHRGPCSGHSRPQRSLFWSLQGTEGHSGDNYLQLGPSNFLVCDLNRTPVVMAKYGGSSVHFSGISTWGEPRKRLFHTHGIRCCQLCTKYLYLSTLLWQINSCDH